MQVLFDGEVEGVAVFEVDGDVEAGADFFEGEELVRLGGGEAA